MLAGVLCRLIVPRLQNESCRWRGLPRRMTVRKGMLFLPTQMHRGRVDSVTGATRTGPLDGPDMAQISNGFS